MTNLTLAENNSVTRDDYGLCNVLRSLPAVRGPAADSAENLEATNTRLRLTIQRLERLVYIDDLTRLPNRRFFDGTLDAEVRRAVRDKQPMSLFLCDIDRFKRHNDTFGHRGGDALLRLIADVLQRYCRRAGDVAARYGGEEFALILPRLKARPARKLADELRRTVAELTISHRDSKDLQRVTMSIGVTTFSSTKICTSGEIVDAADTALYKAKNAGRNRTRYQSFRPW